MLPARKACAYLHYYCSLPQRRTKSSALLQNPNSMGWVALDACLLIMFLVVIRFLTYVALRHKTAAK